MYWPSFNGIFAIEDHQNMTSYQTRAFLNTVLSLASCVVATFGFSSFFSKTKRFNMVHIQNSTLAGGVAVGASANLYLTPSGAMGVGFVAAFISVFGFSKISDILQERFNIADTCGVHNLHGMPGVFGAIVSAIAIACATTNEYHKDAFDKNFGAQAGYQILGVVITLVISIVGGLITGLLLRYVTSFIVS